MEAAAALVDNNLPLAEARLRTHLAAYPKDVAALRMLAEVAGRLRRYADAEALLEECLRLAPSFDAARHNYAVVLNRAAKPAAALPQVERLLAKEPRNPGYLNLKAAILANLGEYVGSIAVYRGVLDAHPQQPLIWMSLGHALKTEGESEQSIAAYRRAIEMRPSLGEAYWSLANLKTFRFSAEDVAAMRGALARPDLTTPDRLHFEFALGKALEDEQVYEASFRHYAKGNAIHRQQHPYSADENKRFIEHSRHLFTRDFFRATGRFGFAGARSDLHRRPAARGLDPARADSLEPLAGRGHGRAARHAADRSASSPAATRTRRRSSRRSRRSSPNASGRSAEGYLASTRVHRKTGAPFFIDKMPNNCLYVGLIHLILPNAKIIDARRHPLGCCFSAFKQHFARGQSFTYDLADLGRYYRDYVELMAHIDAVLPGRVHRVFYETMIEDTEGEVTACSTTVACRSRSDASSSTRTSGRCAPRARSRCVGPSSATASTSGGTTSGGSDHCSRRSARY